MINEFEYRLHDVPRWAIVRTIRKQSVAEHSFYVALIAERIASQWFNIEMTPNEQLELNRYALLHDQWEAFSGDVAGMVKDCFDEHKLKKRYISYVAEVPVPKPWMRDVVKCADLFERCYFLAVERNMGNNSIDQILMDNMELLLHSLKGSAVKFIEDVTEFMARVATSNIRTMDLRDAKT